MPRGTVSEVFIRSRHPTAWYTCRQTMVLHTDPYKGTARKVVLAIDIGTTFSGAAYCVLDPGEVPKVISITR